MQEYEKIQVFIDFFFGVCYNEQDEKRIALKLNTDR